MRSRGNRDGPKSGDSGFDWLRIIVLSLGHMVNDTYSNLIPLMIPILLAAPYYLNYTLSGLIVTIFTITSSVIQPFFGYVADRHGRRWMVALSVLWISFFMSLVGLVGVLELGGMAAYGVIVLCVALAGFGSSAYHPQASAMVPRISGLHKGVGVSIFSAGGNLGYAIMPLLFLGVTTLWGLSGLLVLVVPGIAMALLLQRYAPEAPQVNNPPNIRELWGDIMAVRKPLSVVTGVVCMRAWLFFGLIAFLPSYLMTAQGWAKDPAYLIITVILAFGAIGTLLGGWMSDRYGRKFTIVASLALTAPLLFLGLSAHGLLIWALTAMAGLALLASFSPAVLIAQGLIPKNQGMASGIILGFAIGIGGLGVSVTGAISDTLGIDAGAYSLVLLPVAALLFALLLPGRITPERR